MFVDLFSDSGGVHAAACCYFSLCKTSTFKSSFGMLYEHQTIKFSTTDIGS